MLSGLAVHIAERDLGLGVRAQPGQAAVLAQHGLALHQPVRQVDGHGHQGRGFVAGIAEHQALVAGALVQVVVGGPVHALGDVRALLAVADMHRAAVGVEAQVGVGIADGTDGFPRHPGVVDLGVGGDLARQHHQAGAHQGFGGDAGGGVLDQDGVQDGIGNLVGDLVRMAFGNGFRGEEIIFAH
jgi:hypothetical protein